MLVSAAGYGGYLGQGLWPAGSDHPAPESGEYLPLTNEYVVLATGASVGTASALDVTPIIRVTGIPSADGTASAPLPTPQLGTEALSGVGTASALEPALALAVPLVSADVLASAPVPGVLGLSEAEAAVLTASAPSPAIDVVESQPYPFSSVTIF